MKIEIQGMMELTRARSKHWRSHNLTNILFILPALLFFSLFVTFPIITSAYYSLTDWNGIDLIPHFVGLRNFVELFHSPEFLSSLRVTLTFAIIVTVIQNVLALLLALALNRFLRHSTPLRVLFLAPTLISSIAIGYIWSYLLQPLFGFVNAVLGHVGLASLAHDWLGDPRYALGSIIFIGCWQWVGFNTIIYLAGLQLVPADFYEAAKLDGAGSWQLFRYVTFPLIAPAFTVNIVLILIGGLRVFDVIIATTGGGPAGLTRSVLIEIYNEAFLYSRFGYATAMSLVVFIAMLGLSILILAYLRRREVAY